jgi:hypothetical protein
MASTAPDPGERATTGPPTTALTRLEPTSATVTKEKKREPNILMGSKDKKAWTVLCVLSLLERVGESRGRPGGLYTLPEVKASSEKDYWSSSTSLRA